MTEPSEKKEKKLFEIFVYTEWRQEPEPEKCEPTPSKLSPFNVLSYLNRKDNWPKESYFRHIDIQLPWHISLSPDGNLVAVLTENILEIRTTKDDFAYPIGRVSIRKDPVPQQRKLSWSPDNVMIAVGTSRGIINVYDFYGVPVWSSLNIAESKSPSPPLRDNNFLIGLEFLHKRNIEQPNLFDLVLLNIYSDGTVNTYRMIGSGRFCLDSKTNLCTSRISCAAYSHKFNIVFIATEPENVSKAFLNTSFSTGLSAWCVKEETQRYEKVFPMEDELKLFNKSTSRFFTYFQQFKIVEAAVKLIISPNNQILASLHSCGNLFFWHIPGLRLYRKWTPADVNVNHPVTWDTDVCIPVDIEWLNDEEIVISRKDGTIFIHKVDDFGVVFGSQQAPTNGHPRLTSIATFPGFLALECENLSVPPTPQEILMECNSTSTIMSMSTSDLLQSAIYMLTDLEKYQPKKKVIKYIQHTYRLIGVKNTTPEELFYRKLQNHEFDKALQLVHEYGMNEDIVYQEQWKSCYVSENSINLYLNKVQDKIWVLNECVERVPDNLTGALDLIEYGYKITNVEAIFPAHSKNIDKILELFKSSEELSDFQKLAVKTRITLINHEKKLETFKMILGNVDVDENFNSEEYGLFRKHSYVEAAINFARLKNSEAVKILIERHSHELMPFWLVILQNFPETMKPSSYSEILPECDGDGIPVMRPKTVDKNSDWTNKEFFRAFHSSDFLEKLAETFGKPCLHYSSQVFTDWYLNRALAIEDLSHIIDNGSQLLKLGRGRNIKGLEDLLEEFSTLETLVYELDVDISYKEFSKMSSLEKASIFLKNIREEHFLTNTIKYILPFLDRVEKNNPQQKINLLVDFLIHTSKKNLQSSISFFYYVISGNFKIIGQPDTLISLVASCLYNYNRTDKFAESLDLIDDIIEWASSLSQDSSYEPFLKKLYELRNEVFAAEKLRLYSIVLSLEEVHSIKNDEESIKRVIERMAESARNDWSDLRIEGLQTYFQDALMLQSIIFSKLSVQHFYEVYIRALLNSGLEPCIELASSVLCCRRDDQSDKNITYKQSVDLILESSRRYFNSSHHYDDENMNLAKSCLYVIKDENDSIQEELDLIRSLRYLHDFKIDVIPLQVRESEDKLKWIDRVIYKNPKIYKNPQLIFKLAASLRLFGDNRLERQTVLTTRLAEVAFENGDLKRCSEFCTSLMEWESPVAWKICLQLGQCEKYPEIAQKLKLLLFASIHCPPSYLIEILNSRKSLEIKAAYASTQKSGKANRENDVQLEERHGAYVLNSVDKCYNFFLTPIENSKLKRPIHFKFNSNDMSSKLSNVHYSFYSEIHKDCQESKCHEGQTGLNFSSETTKIPIVWLMHMNRYDDDSLLNEVIIGLALKYVSENTMIAIGYLLTLNDPRSAEGFFLNVPESPFVFQLAIYYYSLCSLSSIEGHPSLRTPQEVVSWVNHQDPSKIKYFDLINKHKTRYANYMQAQQVVSLQVGINSERFMKDADYRKDTILGLAMNCDKLNLAIELALENDVSVAEVAITHIVSLLFENDEDSLFQSLGNAKFSDILYEESEIIKERMISLLPSFDGFNHQKLIMLFNVLKALDNQTPVHFLIPSEHIDLITKITDLLPDLDYKELIENHSSVVEALKQSMSYKEDDFLKLIKALKMTVNVKGYNFKDGEIFLEIAIKEFQEKCLHEKSKSDWVSQFSEIFAYLSKVDSDLIKTFVDETLFSKEAPLSLDYEGRLVSLDLLLEWCMEANAKRGDMDDVLEYVHTRKSKLKKIWTTEEDSNLPINAALKSSLASLENNFQNEEIVKKILIDCVLKPSITKDDLLRFYKASRITVPLEHIICSLPKEHPEEFSIIMRRISEIGADSSFSSLDNNDWGEEEELESLYKNVLQSESISDDESSLEYRVSGIKTNSKEISEDSENSDFSEIEKAFEDAETPEKIFQVFNASGVEKRHGKGPFLALKYLYPMIELSKYQYSEEIVKKTSAEALSKLINENGSTDILFSIWLCLCSDTSMTSLAKRFLLKIQVDQIKTYIMKINDYSTSALTDFLVESSKFWEAIDEIYMTEPDYDFKTLSDKLSECGLKSEAKFIKMKADNIPHSLINFHSSLQ